MNALNIQVFRRAMRFATTASILLLFYVTQSWAETTDSKNETTVRFDEMSVIGSKTEDVLETAGSAKILSEEQLEKFEYDDIHRVLDQVPGVNLRGEDGYGLRPNIGMRGSTTERSQKITLLEDSILIAPAPYSAPSAYYFPLVSKMTAIEVVKGPGSIIHGPNTVGGAINLQTRPVPLVAEGSLDFAVGSDGYEKLHAHFGNSGERFGWLLEGMHLGSDGFKDLPNGDDTGFDKKSLMAKLQWINDPSSRWYQQFDLKLGYSDEQSNETYLGLTDSDFSRAPYQRYAASQNARMDWEHQQAQISHAIEFDEDVSVRTTLYRNSFERAWTKLNSFQSDDALSNILANPEAGFFAAYYDVLRGTRDSDLNSLALVVGTNDRSYLSQGIQSQLRWQIVGEAAAHEILVGLRFHSDEIQRNHTENDFLMQSGLLVSNGAATDVITLNDQSANAWSVYMQDTINWQSLTMVAGLRIESIEYESQKTIDNSLTVNRTKINSDDVVLPSLAAHYQVSNTLAVFAGVHQGFVPTGPGQLDSIEPEESVNYELGSRYQFNNTSAELIGFFSDYSNLLGTCTFSASCVGATGEAFNGGAVNVYGIEASLGRQWDTASGVIPLSITYTYTDSEFQNEFLSSFPLWGNVSAGDSIPYIPKHKLNVTLGFTAGLWSIVSSVTHTGEQGEQAGQDGALENRLVDSHSVIDVSAYRQLGEKQRVYLNVANALDEEYLLSRRPFGARPGRPRSATLGYKYDF